MVILGLLLATLVLVGGLVWIFFEVDRRSKNTIRWKIRIRTRSVQGYCEEKILRIGMALVDEAEEGMEILDTGIVAEGSLYNHELFVESVSNKINKNPNFRIRCFFDVGDEELLFIKRLKRHPRVQLFVRKDKTKRSEKLYKAIDWGVKVYVSKDDLVDLGETCDEIDLSSLSQRDRRLVSKFLLEEIRQPMEEFERLEGLIG